MGDYSIKQELFHKTCRGRMIVRSICYIKTRGEIRATKGDKRGTEYNDVQGIKEESGGKKVDQF